MIGRNTVGDTPHISGSTYVHPTAILQGNVVIEENCFIGPMAIIRADEVDDDGKVQPIIIKSNCNIQDGVIIHSARGKSVHIGPEVSITHGAIVHGPCTIESGCLIGFNSVVYNAFLEKDVVVLHNAVVEMVTIPSRKVVPANSTIIYPEDFSSLQEYTPAIEKFCRKVIDTYQKLTYGYLAEAK
ncbi:MAG: carbonate dehydratase [Calditrichaeota bacterium]|nr:carbonate dehydratase [Calditrichota bacterium]RQV98435.1 MAG: carbonate dehydratase [Calditrichota bacterium]